MTMTSPPQPAQPPGDTTRAAAPAIPDAAPGTYAGGARSPIIWALLCPSCAGYAPMTPEGYDGFLTGKCQGCGSYCRELHKFRAFIHSAEECGCRSEHRRVTGDLAVLAGRAAAPAIPDAAQAAEAYIAGKGRTWCGDWKVARDAFVAGWAAAWPHLAPAAPASDDEMRAAIKHASRVSDRLGYEDGREALAAKLRELHKPFGIHDECDCNPGHNSYDEGVTDCGEFSTCLPASYHICAHCCLDANDEMTEECAAKHRHGKDLPICPTVALLDPPADAAAEITSMTEGWDTPAAATEPIAEGCTRHEACRNPHIFGDPPAAATGEDA